MEWLKEIMEKKETGNETMSFSEYIDYFLKNVRNECRPSYQYLLDMLNYFGKSRRNHFKLFQLDHDDAPPVFGQFKPVGAIYQNLLNFKEEGINNKFILLIGPNGSSKTSLIRKLMKGAEAYSETPEGALFTFSWIFPIDNYVKGSLGLGTNSRKSNIPSYAVLEDKDITAILPSELKDHPLLLIPIEQRQELFDNKLKDIDLDLYESVKKSYLYKGDLSKRNRMIYDALLKNYKGDHNEVLKHIRVEQFKISKRYSVGTVTIEPQIHIDAHMQQITMDKRLATLPPSLQSLNLFSLQGESVLANRGILEYSDLLKRPIDAFKYLLMTTETGTINLQGILTSLDILSIGTSNEIHMAAFKQHPDFNSFKGRFNFVRVPYLLDYKNEAKIYRKQVHGLSDKTIFEPHSVSILSLFAVMTRLRCSQASNYKEKRLAEIALALNPLEKALLFSEEKVIPEHLNSESQSILRQGLNEIKAEFVDENLYEGKFGISPRDIKKIIYDISSSHANVTFIEIMEYLEKLITKKDQFDFLNMSAQSDYHNPRRCIDILKEYSLDIFDKELRNSLGLVDERSYEDYIKRYIENIKAQIKGEKIKNTVTGKDEECDEYFIKEFEKNIALKEDAHAFRSHLISKFGAYYLDNPGKEISYNEVFPELIKKLQESFREEQKKVIQSISKNLVFYESQFSKDKKVPKGAQTPLSEENKKQISTTIDNLTSKHHYTEKGAMALLKYTIKQRY